MRCGARSPARRRGGRALLAFGIGAAAAGTILAVTALRPSSPDLAVLSVTDARAPVAPSTVAPLANTAPPATAQPPDDPRPAAGPTTTTSALSPLAALLGEAGTAIPPSSVEPRVPPTGLTIGAAGVDHPVRSVGLEESGELDVPDATEIGWYRYGAAPGSAGATVLAAHVTWNGDLGPFLRLGEVEPGDRVEVALQDGSARIYEVVERTMYDKHELPRERIWRNTGDETLVLITCGGDFDRRIRSYRQNIVVYAVPVGVVTAPMS